MTERITVPGQPAAGRHDRRGLPLRPLAPTTRRASSTKPAAGRPRSGTCAGPATRRWASAPAGASSSRRPRACGGGFDADVTRLASGVDLYDRLLGVAFGDAALERQGVVGPAHGGAIAKFLVARPGTVRAVRGLDAARARSAGSTTSEVFVARRRARLAAHRQREARGLRAGARSARRSEATARADEALGAPFYRHGRRVVRRGDRVTHGPTAMRTPTAPGRPASGSSSGSGSRATRCTASPRTGTRARRRGAGWRARSGPPTRSTSSGTSASARSLPAPWATSRGRRIADVGCGTGRITRWLAEQRRARQVIGIDFSQATVEAATPRVERARVVGARALRAGRRARRARRRPARGRSTTPSSSAACRWLAATALALERAMVNVARLVRHGGRVLILEPIHRSPLLRRVLDLGLEDWIAAANRAGLVARRRRPHGVRPRAPRLQRARLAASARRPHLPRRRAAPRCRALALCALGLQAPALHPQLRAQRSPRRRLVTLATYGLLFVAAAVGGAINSVAGGGSFVAFPALLFAGVPAVPANATNTIALWPGSVASAVAYRRELRDVRRELVPLGAASLVGRRGGVAPAPPHVGPYLRPAHPLAPAVRHACSSRSAAVGDAKAPRRAPRRRSGSGIAAQLCIGVYGGYFGGGIGHHDARGPLAARA